MRRLKSVALAVLALYVLVGASWAVHKYLVQQDTLIFLKAVEMQGNVRCSQT